MDGGAWWPQSMGSQRVGHNWATNAFTFVILWDRWMLLSPFSRRGNLRPWLICLISYRHTYVCMYVYRYTYTYIYISSILLWTLFSYNILSCKFPFLLALNQLNQNWKATMTYTTSEILVLSHDCFLSLSGGCRLEQNNDICPLLQSASFEMLIFHKRLQAWFWQSWLVEKIASEFF